jgi:hypothetical protein
MRKKRRNSLPFPSPSPSALTTPSRTPTTDNPARRSWRSQGLNHASRPAAEELWASPQRRRYLLSLQPEGLLLA